MKKISVYSHKPGFRRWGREWSLDVETVGIIKKLGKGSRTARGCDFAITEAEYAQVKPLAEHAEFPLCISEGEAPAAVTRAETDRLRCERDGLARSLDELRVQREAIERELAELAEQREAASREVTELRDAARAAEKRAVEAEQKLEAMASAGQPSSQVMDK